MHSFYKFISFLFMPLVYLNTYLRLIRKKEDADRYKERFGYTNFKQILKKE